MATPSAPAAEVAGASPPVLVLRRLAAALHYRDFRVLWAGAFTSSIGTWMQRVTQSWLVLTIAGPSSAFFLGLDSFLGEAPILLFTLIGGVVADRRDRRQLLLTSQYVPRWRRHFTLAALVYWDVIRIWHVLTLSVVTGVAQAFGGPAYQSLVPSLIDKQHLPNAIALNSIQFNLARVIGPLIAGAALTAFGMAVCFGLNGVSFLAVIVALLSAAHFAHIPATNRSPMYEELRSGLSYVRHQPGLVGLTFLAFTTTYLGTPLLTFLPLFTQKRVPRRRRPVHTAHGLRGRRRRRRRARRRLARQVSRAWDARCSSLQLGLRRAGSCCLR